MGSNDYMTPVALSLSSSVVSVYYSQQSEVTERSEKTRTQQSPKNAAESEQYP